MVTKPAMMVIKAGIRTLSGMTFLQRRMTALEQTTGRRSPRRPSRWRCRPPRRDGEMWRRRRAPAGALASFNDSLGEFFQQWFSHPMHPLIA